MPVEPPPDAAGSFPDPDDADESDVVGRRRRPRPGHGPAGLPVGTVPDARRPGPHAGLVVARPRGVLPLDGLRVTRSLRASCRRFEIRVDTAFDDVVEACADPDATARLDHRRDPRRLRAAARAGLGPQRRGVVARRRHARRRAVRHLRRRAVRRRVDVPPPARRLEGGAGRPRRAPDRRRRGPAARRAVDHRPPAQPGRGRHRAASEYLERLAVAVERPLPPAFA